MSFAETDSQIQRTDLWLPKGEMDRWGRDRLEIWVSRMQTIIYSMGKQLPPGLSVPESPGGCSNASLPGLSLPLQSYIYLRDSLINLFAPLNHKDNQS